MASRFLFEQSTTKLRPSYVVYVMPCGYGGAVAEAQAIVRDAAHVIDVDDAVQRDPFLRTIVRVGRSGSAQGELLPH